MNSLDEMTLRLICNKKLYNKYVETTEPDTHRKKQAFQAKLQKYRGKIMDLTREFLLNPEKEYSVAVNEMFQQFCETLVHYLEHKELDDKYGGEYENDPTEESDGESDLDSESRSESSSESPRKMSSEDLSRTPEFSDVFSIMRMQSVGKGCFASGKSDATKGSSTKGTSTKGKGTKPRDPPKPRKKQMSISGYSQEK